MDSLINNVSGIQHQTSLTADLCTDTIIVRPGFFCQISSGELSTASSEGNARIMVVDEQRRRQLDDVSNLYVFEGLCKIIVSVEDFDAL